MNRSSSFTLLACLLLIGTLFFFLKEERLRADQMEVIAAVQVEGERAFVLEEVRTPAAPETLRTVEAPMAPFNLYSPTIIPPEAIKESEEVTALRAEIGRLNIRVAELEAQVSLSEGQVGTWAKLLRPEEKPDQATMLEMSRFLVAYPVVLQPHEGLWLAERIVKDDWKLWAPTVDEAIFTYLGEARLQRELTPSQLEACKP